MKLGNVGIGRAEFIASMAALLWTSSMIWQRRAKLESEGGRGQRRLLRLSQAFDEEQVSPKKNG
ncbi:hypothetical protein OROHE_021495 [Orobanche hederae]